MEATRVRADSGLVDRARSGDVAAFEALMLPMQPAGYRLAFALLGDPHAAEDALQEACVKAWRKFHQFRYGASPQSWFLTIVANQCRSMTRSPWWSVVKRADVAVTESRPEPSVASNLAVREALDRLPFEHRLVLYLYYCEDMSQQQVATTMGIKEGTVKSRIHRALVRLRREFPSEPDF
jgi:RNA polymerase sigma-70 factor, ECF subfamily